MNEKLWQKPVDEARVKSKKQSWPKGTQNDSMMDRKMRNIDFELKTNWSRHVTGHQRFDR